jgi:hypothetical protein
MTFKIRETSRQVRAGRWRLDASVTDNIELEQAKEALVVSKADAR